MAPQAQRSKYSDELGLELNSTRLDFIHLKLNRARVHGLNLRSVYIRKRQPVRRVLLCSATATDSPPFPPIIYPKFFSSL